MKYFEKYFQTYISIKYLSDVRCTRKKKEGGKEKSSFRESTKVISGRREVHRIKGSNAINYSKMAL